MVIDEVEAENWGFAGMLTTEYRRQRSWLSRAEPAGGAPSAGWPAPRLVDMLVAGTTDPAARTLAKVIARFVVDTAGRAEVEAFKVIDGDRDAAAAAARVFRLRDTTQQCETGAACVN